MSNIMDYIKSGKGLPPLEDNIPPMPEVKPPREKIIFRRNSFCLHIEIHIGIEYRWYPENNRRSKQY